MTEQEQAADTLQAYENMPHYLRLRLPMGKPWCPPALTPEQQAKQDQYIEEHRLPF